jgi:hypothetical protein
MAGETPEPRDPAKQVLAFAAAWKEAIGAIVLLVAFVGENVTGFMSWVGVPPHLQKPFIVILLLAAAGLAWQAYRNRRDRPQPEPMAQRPAQMAVAFRGLDRFNKGDELPGAARRTLAIRIAQRVLDPQTAIVIVVGASGAGKSSLLQSAVTRRLEEGDCAIALVGSPARLAQAGSGAGTATDLEQLLAALAKKFGPLRDSPDGRRALVIDQFEEFFTRYADRGLRTQVGTTIREIINIGICPVIGLREEYLAQFANMMGTHGVSIALTDTILVENFTEAEAAAVVVECAEHDGIRLDPELPSAVAADLSHKGAVRPAELQLVCSALGQSLTLEEYRRRGGAAGVLSSHVANATRLTPDPALARAILRALCDIQAGTKHPEPLTATALLAALPERVRDNATETTVEHVLVLLEQARLIIVIGDTAQRLWSLIHDYLVEPIKLATQGESARSEEAAAKLQGYVAQARKGMRPVVPLGDLSLIRRHASRDELARPEIRSLLLRSFLLGYGKPAGLALGAGIVGVFAVGLSATRWGVWHAKPGTEMGFWDGAEASTAVQDRAEILSVGPNEERRVVSFVTRIFFSRHDIAPWRFTFFERLAVWNPQTGERIQYIPTQGLLPLDNTLDRFWAFQGPLREVREMNLKGDVLRSINLAGEQRPEALRRIIDVDSSGVTATAEERTVWVFDSQTTRWAAVPVPGASERPGASGRYWGLGAVSLVEPSDVRGEVFVEDALTSRVLWRHPKAPDSSVIGGLRDTAGNQLLSFIIGEPASLTIVRIPALVPGADRMLRTEGSTSVREISVPQPLADAFRRNPRMLDNSFSFQGSTQQSVPGRLLFIDSNEQQTAIWPLNLNQFQFETPIFSALPRPQFRGGIAWTPQGRRSLALWPESEPEPIFVEGIETSREDVLVLTPDRRRLVMLNNVARSAELWDVAGARRIGERMDFVRPVELSLSDDNRAVFFREPGGRTFLWRTEDGERLGSLTMPSRVRYSTYDPACEKLVIWTDEAQRLIYRKGADIPLLGHWPSSRC